MNRTPLPKSNAIESQTSSIIKKPNVNSISQKKNKKKKSKKESTSNLDPPAEDQEVLVKSSTESENDQSGQPVVFEIQKDALSPAKRKSREERISQMREGKCYQFLTLLDLGLDSDLAKDTPEKKAVAKMNARDRDFSLINAWER